MSRIADIHDKCIAKIESVLTSYTRMPNPYEAAENPSLLMRKGFAVGFGPAQNTERMVCGRVSIQRSMTFLLINEVLTTEMNSASRGSFEKSLMDDQFSLIKAFENDSTLDGKTTTLKYESDSGIQYVSGQDERYILVETTLSLEYLENL